MTSDEAIASILERLSAIRADTDVSLVIRHSEREEIQTGTFGYHVALTAQGISSAQQLGAALAERRNIADIATVSSPVPRCVQTAEAILLSAGCSTGVPTDRRLGDPGAFVLEPEIAGSLFLELPIHEIARRQLQALAPLPGMRRTGDGVAILLDLVAGNLGGEGQLNVHVTHDVILAVLVGSIFRLPLEETGWPGFLEGLLLWRFESSVYASWRGIQQGFDHPIGG